MPSLASDIICELMLAGRKSRPPLTAVALMAAAGVVLAAVSAGAQPPPSLDELLARVGKGIEELYQRAQRVICIETSTVQPIDRDRTSQGFARIVESELRVEAGGSDAGMAGETPALPGWGEVPQCT